MSPADSCPAGPAETVKANRGEAEAERGSAGEEEEVGGRRLEGSSESGRHDIYAGRLRELAGEGWGPQPLQDLVLSQQSWGEGPLIE